MAQSYLEIETPVVANGKPPNIVLEFCNNVDEDDSIVDISPLMSSSTDASIATSSGGDDDTLKNDCLADNSCSKFMQTHVSRLFDPTVEITTADKHTFGELCLSPDGRELFAKFVDNKRSATQLLDENTFYKLAHSFALVLFECSEADDFNPAKTLMNMAFTYYHIPEGSSWPCQQTSAEAVDLKIPDMKEFTAHLSEEEAENSTVSKPSKKKSSKRSGRASSNNENKKPFWKTASDFLNTTLFKDSTSTTKKKAMRGKDCNGHATVPSSNTGTAKNDTELRRKLSLTPSDFTTSKKIYLYQTLRNQTIWRSLRFWDAAFFDSVNVERKNACSKLQWSKLTPEERDYTNECMTNVTFGQLGTFINNMKHLGLCQETCLQFLRKQSVIGNLNKELYQTLKSQICVPLPKSS